MIKRKKKPTKKSQSILKPIQVEWEDHFSIQGWNNTIDENPVIVSSVGFVLKETPKMLVLSQNGTEEKVGVGNNIAIIKKCIVKRKLLK